jgi:hypothetical protein
MRGTALGLPRQCLRYCYLRHRIRRPVAKEADECPRPAIDVIGLVQPRSSLRRDATSRRPENPRVPHRRLLACRNLLNARHIFAGNGGPSVVGANRGLMAA